MKALSPNENGITTMINSKERFHDYLIIWLIFFRVSITFEWARKNERREGIHCHKIYVLIGVTLEIKSLYIYMCMYDCILHGFNRKSSFHPHFMCRTFNLIHLINRTKKTQNWNVFRNGSCWFCIGNNDDHTNKVPCNISTHLSKKSKLTQVFASAWFYCIHLLQFEHVICSKRIFRLTFCLYSLRRVNHLLDRGFLFSCESKVHRKCLVWR